MNKQEFLSRLKDGLAGLPTTEIEDRLSFYSEMIDDRIEEGLSEEEAINEIGPIDAVITQILSEIPLRKIVKEKVKTGRKLGAVEIILLILGSPIWLSLLIATVAVVFSVYLAIWSIVVALWSVVAVFAGCFIGGIMSSIIFMLQGNKLTALAILGAAICCGGLFILTILGCSGITKGMVWLTKKFALWIKGLFISKGVS